MSHMSGNSLEILKAKVEAMTVDPQSGYGVLKKLILEDEFDEPISSAGSFAGLKKK